MTGPGLIWFRGQFHKVLITKLVLQNDLEWCVFNVQFYKTKFGFENAWLHDKNAQTGNKLQTGCTQKSGVLNPKTVKSLSNTQSYWKYPHVYLYLNHANSLMCVLWLIQNYLLSYLQVVFTITCNCYHTIACIWKFENKQTSNLDVSY